MITYRIGDKEFKVDIDTDLKCYYIQQDLFEYGMQADWLEAAGLIDWDEIEVTLPISPKYNKDVYEDLYYRLNDITECEKHKLYDLVGYTAYNSDILEIEGLEYGEDWNEDDLKGGAYENCALQALAIMAYTEPARIGMEDFICELIEIMRKY